jgi:hypothetical protein
MSGLDKKIKHRKKKNKKGKKSPTDNVASLYKEDIGFEGVKKRRMLLTNDNIGPFELPVNEKEESKRQKRMVRDWSGSWRVRFHSLVIAESQLLWLAPSCILGKICQT